MRPRRLRVLAIVVLAGWVSPSVARGDHVCERGEAVASGDRARVVFLDEHLWGCVEGRRRAFVVAHPADFGSWEHVTVAGTYAAIELIESSQECESRDVRVVDLRTGRSWTRPARSAEEGGPCDGHPVSDLVLRSDGLVAFIAGGQVIRWSVNRKRTILLDGGPAVDPRSLAFDRGGVRWTAAGERRRAALPRRRE